MNSIAEVKAQMVRAKDKLAGMDTGAVPTGLEEAESALSAAREQVAAAMGAVALAKEKLEAVQAAHTAAKATVDEARGLLGGAVKGTKRQKVFELNTAVGGLRSTVNDERLAAGRLVDDAGRIEASLSSADRSLDSLRGRVHGSRDSYSDHAAAVEAVNNEVDDFMDGM